MSILQMMKVTNHTVILHCIIEDRYNGFQIRRRRLLPRRHALSIPRACCTRIGSGVSGNAYELGSGFRLQASELMMVNGLDLRVGG